MCYAENVTPKEALIVKEWNIIAKNIAKCCYSFCVYIILTSEIHCEKSNEHLKTCSFTSNGLTD